MKLKYQTASATLIQFIVATFLNIADSTSSIVTTCRKDGGDCVSNLIATLILFMILTACFAAIWVAGYAAQEQRSRRLSKFVLSAEAIIVLVTVFNIKHPSGKLGIITNIVDLVLALWVMVLAWRLMRAGGQRIVSRPRERRHPTERQ